MGASGTLFGLMFFCILYREAYVRCMYFHQVEFSGLYYVALTQRAAMSLLSDRAAYVRGLHNSGSCR